MENLSRYDQWLNFYLGTFVLLHPKTDPRTVIAKMNSVYQNNARDQLKEAKEKYNFEDKVIFGLQPILQIHLSADYRADDELSDASSPVNSYILSGIAVFLLLIACINFINLTVAQSLKRSKEIGIRKVVGGQRSQLVRQFLGESFILCFIAFIFGLALAELSLPVFNNLSNKQLSLQYLFDPQLVAGFIGLFLITGFAAGFYPALVLSGFNPVQALYKRTRLAGKNYLAKGLVIVQFSLSLVLIITTLFISAQFRFLTHADLGYNDKNIVVVSMGKSDNDLLKLFKSTLSGSPGIQMVAGHNSGRNGTIAHVDGKEIQFDYETIDENYLRALEVPFVKGRNFSPEYPSDSNNSIIVNETFARNAGWSNPIGKTADFFWKNRKLTVVGVVKDYHFRSLKEKIGATFLKP